MIVYINLISSQYILRYYDRAYHLCMYFIQHTRLVVVGRTYYKYYLMCTQHNCVYTMVYRREIQTVIYLLHFAFVYLTTEMLLLYIMDRAVASVSNWL